MPWRGDLVDPDAARPATPIHPVSEADYDLWLENNSAARGWLMANGFTAEPGSWCPLPGNGGGMGSIVLGIGDDARWDWAAVATQLPSGCYRVAGELPLAAADAAAFGWAMGRYGFSRYHQRSRPAPQLVWPVGADRERIVAAIEATVLARDLINTPASDMGPEELADAARSLARQHGARVRVITGTDLLRQDYPAIYAVGCASARAPRLIDLSWGDESRPKVSLVGKGVCFDSGGLDLKPSSAMKLMKKDMGGGAIVLGAAHMVMSAGLPVRLRVLIPAVENSVSGSAMRPLDVIQTRKGLTVEIGNTDAEGRVILADALAEAAGEDPALLVDVATLTGAARVALGSELPALFTPDDALAAMLLEEAEAAGDPLWRLPLWQAYRRHIEGKVADLTNAPDSPYAGAIVAALFLAEFVTPVRAWAHLDVMAWNIESRPGRPEGGEAMGMRALFGLIERRWPAVRA